MATVSTNTHIEFRTGNISEKISEDLKMVVYEAVPFAKTVAPVDTGYLREGIYPLSVGNTHSLVIPAHYASIVAYDQSVKRDSGKRDSVYSEEILSFIVNNLINRGIEFEENVRSEWEYIKI